MLNSGLRNLSGFSLAAILGIVSMASTQAVAEPGPAVVAKADHHLWREAINSPAGFDRASRASILVYALALQDMQKLTDEEMLSLFKIKSVNRASVEKWESKERAQSLLNYQLASKNCLTNDWTCVGNVSTAEELAKKSAEAVLIMPNDLFSWRDNLSVFSHSYVAEQMRLAALFPKVSSEIDLFSPNEFNGETAMDKQFYLSFDDGPTGVHGTTDETLAMLDAAKKSAVFFVLGENFQTRLKKTDISDLATLYQNQCVGSHGWEHQSHAKWDQWQESIKHTQTLLNSTVPTALVPLFRPPYGQRKEDSGSYFESKSLRVALWNLDSQDWNSHVDSNDITNRMVTLMLIKRHGVLLFHDVHPKAKVALPKIFEKVGNSVEWGECQKMAQIH
jgi:peptidoglycan/xylan/chitin deacetylase (PgdA/CDA1 family)